MQSNEELAVLVKQGDREAMALLWEQVHRLIFKLAARYFPLCSPCGLDRADLEQECFFAMLSAARAYDPGKGYLFSSCIDFHVRNVLREALGLRRGNQAPSLRYLDEPMPDHEVALVDTLEDPDAAAALEAVEHEPLASILEGCISSLPVLPAMVIRQYYLEGRTLGSIAGTLGVSYQQVRQLKAKGLKSLRHPRITRRLLTCWESTGLVGTGLTSFRHRGFVSAVEVDALSNHP